MKHLKLGMAISLLLVILFSSCNDDNEIDKNKLLLVGTWQLTSVKLNNVDELVDSYPDYLQFRTDQIYISYKESGNVLTRGGWSYENNMLNISVDLPAAYYIQSVDDDNLSLKRFDFNSSGTLDTLIKNYTRTDDSKIPE